MAREDCKGDVESSPTDSNNPFTLPCTPAHESKFSHELVAGAASFEAMRAYEQHEAREGKPANHALAKELLVGFAGAEVGECAANAMAARMMGVGDEKSALMVVTTTKRAAFAYERHTDTTSAHLPTHTDKLFETKGLDFLDRGK